MRRVPLLPVVPVVPEEEEPEEELPLPLLLPEEVPLFRASANRACWVRGPASPSLLRPLARWNLYTAFSVPLP